MVDLGGRPRWSTSVVDLGGRPRWPISVADLGSRSRWIILFCYLRLTDLLAVGKPG